MMKINWYLNYMLVSSSRWIHMPAILICTIDLLLGQRTVDGWRHKVTYLLCPSFEHSFSKLAFWRTLAIKNNVYRARKWPMRRSHCTNLTQVVVVFLWSFLDCLSKPCFHQWLGENCTIYATFTFVAKISETRILPEVLVATKLKIHQC